MRHRARWRSAQNDDHRYKWQMMLVNPLMMNDIRHLVRIRDGAGAAAITKDAAFTSYQPHPVRQCCWGNRFWRMAQASRPSRGGSRCTTFTLRSVIIKKMTGAISTQAKNALVPAHRSVSLSDTMDHCSRQWC